jgi:hypothetical protein
LFEIKFKLNIVDIIILVYILFQVILLILFRGLTNLFLPSVYLAAALLVLLMALVIPRKKPSFYHFIRYISPLLLLYVFYRLIGVQLSLVGFHSHDPVLYNLEKSVLGIYPTFVMQRLMEVWLNEVTYALYFSGVLLFVWALAKFYTRDKIDIFENFIFAATLGGLICLAIISVFPNLGPGKALYDYYYLGIYGPRFSVAIPVLMSILTPGVGSFPSIYFCLLTIASYYLWDYGRRYIIVSFVVLTIVFWGGIYLRYHYLLDALAALLIAFISATTANFVFFLKHSQNIEKTDSI